MSIECSFPDKASYYTSACALDLNHASVSRRCAQKSVAQRIARKRILFSWTRNDEPLAAYRSRSPSLNGFAAEEYNTLEFLNAHDIVLAADRTGRAIDIVRLPRDEHQTSMSMGSLLSTIRDPTSGNEEIDGQVCLKSLDGGRSFVAGYSDGTYVVYHTELAPSYNELNRHNQRLGGLTTPPLELSSTQYQGPEFSHIWDFCETPSAFLVCAVQYEQPSGNGRFCTPSLYITDDRVSRRPALSIRIGEYGGCESIRAMCFASDHSVATVHLSGQGGDTASTKIFDIRSTKSKPAAEVPLPSSNFGIVASYPAIYNGKGLVPSLTSHHLFVTAANSKMVLNYTIDPLRQSIVKQHQTTSSVGVVQAITPSLDMLAVCNQSHESNTLSLFDLEVDEDKATPKPSSRKRKMTVNELEESPHLDKLGEPFLLGKTPIKIRDEYGIRSRLTSLAFNETGTSLVGGSEEGDLFLWRGG